MSDRASTFDDVVTSRRSLRAFLPRELGGDELPPVALLSIVEEVARQDGSSGWCLGMNGIITGICASRLSDAGLDRIYGDADPSRILMAGGFPPMGRSVREGEAWRVSESAWHPWLWCCRSRCPDRIQRRTPNRPSIGP